MTNFTWYCLCLLPTRAIHTAGSESLSLVDKNVQQEGFGFLHLHLVLSISICVSERYLLSVLFLFLASQRVIYRTVTVTVYRVSCGNMKIFQICITTEMIYTMPGAMQSYITIAHDDVIKWKNFLHYWPIVWGIHRSSVNSSHKGQWRGALMFSLICACTNGWVNNGGAGDLRHHRAHYDATVMNCSMGE